MKFRLMHEVFQGVSAQRELNFQHVLTELNVDYGLTSADETETTITLGHHADGGLHVVVTPRFGDDVHLHLNDRKMRRSLRDYKQVIEQIHRATSTAIGPRDLETLDYAKKLVHDEAGEVVIEAAIGPHVDLGHKLARRIFTLAFLITHDLPDQVAGHVRHPR